MGEVPDWYLLLRAARYLRVAPWDLLAQPSIWQEWARMAEQAEAESQRQRQASQARKAGQ